MKLIDHKTVKIGAWMVALGALGFASAARAANPAAPGPELRSTWPQAYSVERDDAAGVLTLSTPYYTIEQDLKRGGAIRRLTLRHGRAANLLVRPLATYVRGEDGAAFIDLGDPAPKVTHRRAGLNEIVTVDSGLLDPQGRGSGLRVKTTYEYRWGYIKIHKELVLPAGGVRLREVCPLSTVLAPSLTGYGYREGKSE